MKLFCIIWLVHVSQQLKCDKRHITAPIGGELLISCSFNTNRFLFSKKYWCRGSAWQSCEIVADSETVTKIPSRWTVIDAQRRGLFVKATGLRLEDSGTYWVGIDKAYVDILTSVEVEVTEVPVSKPTLRFLSPLSDRPTCWGQAVTVRCGSAKGTNVRYEWYQQNHSDVQPVSTSHDLRLHCGFFQSDACYRCVAGNNMGQQLSDLICVRTLMPAQNNCIFAVEMKDQPIYDCVDRLSTTALLSVTSKPSFTDTYSTPANYSSPSGSASDQNQTHQNTFLFKPTGATFPVWYHFLRCGFLLSLMIFLLVVVKFTWRKQKLRRVLRQKKTERTQMHHWHL